MHLKLSTFCFTITCLLNILLESVSSQLILSEEYLSLDMNRNDESNQQQPYSFPDQRPGSIIHQEETIPPSQRKEYVKQVEGHLLQMFGLKSRPKPGKGRLHPYLVHPYLVHLYSDIQSSNSIEATSNTVKRRSVDGRITIKGSHNTIRSHDLKGKTFLPHQSNLPTFPSVKFSSPDSQDFSFSPDS